MRVDKERVLERDVGDVVATTHLTVLTGVPGPGAFLFVIEFIILLEISKARLQQIMYVQAMFLVRGSEIVLCGHFLTLLVF